MGEPFFECLAVIHGLVPRHLSERRDEVLPADPLACDLQVLSGRLGTVVKRVPSEITDVRERAHGDVSIADGCVEHECTVLALHGAQYTLRDNKKSS